MAPSTHTVTNQPPPLVGHDVFTTDRVLAEAVDRHTAPELVDGVREELAELGRSAGSAQAREWGFQANENPPRLRTHDRYGHRIDEVEFHPAWHRLLGKAVSAGLTDAWGRPAGHVRRAAGFLVWSQVEAGHGCPVSMTHAAVPALRADPALAAEWEPRLTSHVYERELGSPGRKPGALFGMAMTEKQGGSDVRANTTAAVPAAGDGGAYLLTGHKWFCSAPMSDGFLVLAQAPDGPTCFLVPRVLADGERNVFAIQRLKDKLGNRSNASAEVEFDGTRARRVGDEGRGAHHHRDGGGDPAGLRDRFRRADAAGGGAGGAPRHVPQGVRRGADRQAADAQRPGRSGAGVGGGDDAGDAAGRRVRQRHGGGAGVPPARGAGRQVLGDQTLYACGGGGSRMPGRQRLRGGVGAPRLLRESPLNSIWEGSGNVQALDVLRALQREPQALNAFLQEVGRARGADHRLDRAIRDLLTELADLDGIEARARRVAERIALVLQGSLLVRWAPPEVADAFCASRLGGDWGTAFGTLPHTLDLGSVVDRARAAA